MAPKVETRQRAFRGEPANAHPIDEQHGPLGFRVDEHVAGERAERGPQAGRQVGVVDAEEDILGLGLVSSSVTQGSVNFRSVRPRVMDRIWPSFNAEKYVLLS